MEFKTVALVGAGAVGSFFISSLMKLGDDFCLIAEGDRKARLEEDGLCINGQMVYPPVKTPDEVGLTDLIIVSVKYTALREALRQVEHMVGEDSAVFVVLNGIDSESIAAEYVGARHVIPSFMRIVSARSGSTVVYDRAATEGIVYGEKDGSISERVTAISTLFTRCGLKHVVSERILEDQWGKFGINVSNNLPQAVLGVGFGAYYDSEHVGFLREKVIEEFTAVAAAEGIRIRNLPTKRSVARNDARFSTLQDIDAGRRTEVEMFLGVLLKLAERRDIAVPFCEYTYHAIRALEEKNAGKFDYRD